MFFPYLHTLDTGVSRASDNAFMESEANVESRLSVDGHCNGYVWWGDYVVGTEFKSALVEEKEETKARGVWENKANAVEKAADL